ncbi:MAG: efflux RND transporter periplasmic adaptor subunit [Limisphaerales bacterium]
MKEQATQSGLSELVRRHPVWVGGVVLVILALVVLVASSGGSDQPQSAYFSVKRGTFTVSVVEGGTLQAVNEVVIRNEVEGTARIIYIVPEGSHVKKDDLLVELDSMQAQDQYNQQSIAFAKAEFALIQAQSQLEIKRSEVESANRAASNKVVFAQMDLDKYLQGEAMVDLLTASNNITKTEQGLSIDRETLRWSEELYKKNYETRNVVDRDRLTVTNSELNLQIQEMQLWMIQNYDFPKKKQEFAAALEEAQREYDRVRQQGVNTVAQYEADLLTQSNTLELNRAKLDRDQQNLGATKRYAPQDGLVVYPFSENRFSSESMIEEGATVRNRQELIKLPDTSRMKVGIKVHESHVNMVEAGQPAFVVLDSMPDRRFAAYVDKVALLPDNQSRFGNPNLKVYATDIVVTDSMDDIKPGVSARAEIIITNIANALSVPIQAVTTLKGKQVCYVKRGGSQEPVQVEVGLFNTRFIQILSGLNEGDEVLLSPPFEQRDLEGAILEEEEVSTLTNRVVRPVAATRNGNGNGESGGGRGGRPGADGAGGEGAQGRMMGQAGGVGAAGAAGGQGGPPAGMDPERMRAQMMQQYDKDGDGELSESERSAMQADMQQRFGNRGGGGGGFPGGGQGRGGGGRSGGPQQ